MLLTGRSSSTAPLTDTYRKYRGPHSIVSLSCSFSTRPVTSSREPETDPPQASRVPERVPLILSDWSGVSTSNGLGSTRPEKALDVHGAPCLPVSACHNPPSRGPDSSAEASPRLRLEMFEPPLRTLWTTEFCPPSRSSFRCLTELRLRHFRFARRFAPIKDRWSCRVRAGSVDWLHKSVYFWISSRPAISWGSTSTFERHISSYISLSASTSRVASAKILLSEIKLKIRFQVTRHTNNTIPV
mmetsp:Transcript_28580/g.71959  ORF Transcript_28580/g.71959 Transcript_28580/m.71959 type:complete len:243 (+) Transcript_28580:994-1722(+)